MKEKEEWRMVPGYEGFYKISTLGRIISLNREYFNGHCMVQIQGQLMTLGKCGKNRYNTIKLRKLGVRKTYRIGVLMGITFFPEYNFKENGKVMDHINNISNDDRLINLQCITSRKNTSKDRTGGTSDCTGVHWHSATKTWRAKISINNKDIHLGTFYNEQEASKAYQKALKHHENGQEVKRHKSSQYSSEHKGVSWDRYKKRWVSTITINRSQFALARHHTEEEARLSYVGADRLRSKFTGDKAEFRALIKKLLES